MGHRNPSHQWDVHKHDMFLLTSVQVRGIDISLRVLHKHLLHHKQAREARVWVEVGDKAHRSGLQGPRACYVVTLYTEPIDQSIIQGMFLLPRLWARILFDFGASHSFIAASCVK